jgi:hypothetical protein
LRALAVERFDVELAAFQNLRVDNCAIEAIASVVGASDTSA